MLITTILPPSVVVFPQNHPQHFLRISTKNHRHTAAVWYFYLVKGSITTF